MTAIVILVLYPVFIYWLFTAPVLPEDSAKKYLTIKEPRNLYESFKLRNKGYAVVAPMRKLLMTLVLVLFQS